MREFLDAILAVIGSESLTDEEFDGVELEGSPAYSKATYLAVRTVLEGRENVSGQVQRLKLYFIARGVDVSDTPKIPTAQSNIFLGGGLDDVAGFDIPSSSGGSSTGGATGPTGPQGPAGPTGPQGPQGESGADGADGENGATGPAGADFTLTTVGTQAAPTALANTATIAVSTEHKRVVFCQGSGGPVTGVLIANGSVLGQEIELEGQSDTNSVTLDGAASNLRVSDGGDLVLVQGSNRRFRWGGSKWQLVGSNYV
jgi:hypothetical protein